MGLLCLHVIRLEQQHVTRPCWHRGRRNTVDTAQAVILAGGKGTRMGVFCQRRAKPSLPFAGSVRVIDFTLSNCVHSLIDDINVLTDYQRESMTGYLFRWASFNNVKDTFRILEPGNGSYLGTADAVYQNIERLENNPSDTVLVLAGDHVYTMDYQKLLAFHRQTGADATIAVIPVEYEEASRFGIVTVDGRVRISSFIEKPDNPPSRLGSMGIYAFKKRVLIERLKEDARREDSLHDFGHVIIPNMVGRDKVAAFRYNGYWRDIGTPGAYLRSNMDLLPENPALRLGGFRNVLTGHQHTEPSRTSSRARIVNSIIGSGCVIEGTVENSVISPGVHIGKQAVVRNSVIMTGSAIGYHSIIDTSIIGEQSTIDEWCIIGFGGAATMSGGSVTMLGDNVAVPPYTAIGRNCTIPPDTGPELFGEKAVIPSNCTVSPSRPRRPDYREVVIHDRKSIRTS
jgi:glucose-1-phosphate adenylyltransferase